MNPLIRDLIILTVTLVTFQLARADDAPPDDATIKADLQARVDKMGQGTGIAVGIVDEHGMRTISFGQLDEITTNKVNADTIFEIGSITKVFTTLLLQDMIERGEMKLDDPVSKFLPKSVKMPTRGGRQITLLDLATHSSGLPRLPGNFNPKDPGNPYRDYTPEQMYEFLSGYELPRDIGAEYEYSNLGVTLLGHAIALKARTNYETLMIDRICRPLKMADTRITLTPGLKARLATGHKESGKAASNWDFGDLPGAGAIRSSVNDLLKFVSPNLGLTESSLTPMMRKTHAIHFHSATSKVDIALGWHITHRIGTDIFWHNGGTGGYRSFIGFDEKRRLGVVVLCNSEHAIDDLGQHLFDTKAELAARNAAKNLKAVTLDGKILDAYVGQYQLAPRAIMTVRRKGDGLTVQLTGQGALKILPSSETEFFLTAVDAQLTFVRDASGQPTKLILHQNGVDQTATRITAQPPKERVAVKVDPTIYDDYAGRYELAAGPVLAFRRQGDQLLAKLAAQNEFEVFPESKTDFFYKIVDAQLTFVIDDQGKATAVILHQNGLDQRAEKTK